MNPILNSQKTHCLRGHPFDEKNTYRYPNSTHRRCRICKSERSRAEYLDKKESILVRRRERRLHQIYGLTVEDREALLVSQDYRCACCGDPVTTGDRNTHIDHDHKTGVVRGILCVRCNQGLGQFKDDPNRLRMAIAYLDYKGGSNGFSP